MHDLLEEGRSIQGVYEGMTKESPIPGNLLIPKGARILVRPDGWIPGPDGRAYAQVYGTAEIMGVEDMLGFVPTRSTNWFLRVGGATEFVLIAGCQIHYLCVSNQIPSSAETLVLE